MAPATPKLVQLKVLVTPDLRRRLKVLAAETGTPMNTLAVEALTALLKRKGAL